LMEGISHEACSLAGTLGLGKLIAFYDDNGISIDGEVEGWFTDDTPKRFEAYGWHVVAKVDGHDPEAIKAAIEEARASDKPSLICCQTIIGKGSPNKQGKEDCHGAALGVDEVALVRETIGWPHAPFVIPDDIYAGWNARAKGQQLEEFWKKRFAAYQAEHPTLAAELHRRMSGQLPADFSQQADAYIAQCQQEGSTVASRKASQNTLNAFGPLLPEFLGGSADLAGSNLTIWSGSKGISASDASGNYLYYGVREFAMSAMMNGIALHGGFIPYGATFLMFMEYARNAVRMAALMKIRSIFVYTHDSIGLGEDGPTHQAVEQVTALRATPNLSTWRPCDAVESAVCWKFAIERKDGPSALIFSRQSLQHQSRSDEQVANIACGGYILSECEGEPEAILLATGSEVQLAMDAQSQLAAQGKKVRVVSMPSTDVFDAQDAAYKESVLPSHILARVAVEALHKDFWYKYVGLDGRIVGMETFGESAPAADLMKHFGFTVDAVVDAVEDALG
jgi:transketolase